MKQLINKSLVFFLLLFLCLNVKALDYEITKYDIEMIVNNDNTFDIKETIDTYFNVKRHGIYRILPIKNEIRRLDGTTSTNRARITNINVNHEYITTNLYNDFEIRIGDPNYEYTGPSHYVISYRYNIGNDKNKAFDELYYNIIGTRWDTTISNITFKITMPKSFDQSKLGFAKGDYGSTNNDGITYQVNGNVITGSYNGILNPSEGLTVRLELPNGYFSKQKDTTIYLIYIIIISSLGIAFIVWLLFGKNKNSKIEVIEFYPPNGLNSLEVGRIYKGEASKKDAMSLLIYLANKGYIKISKVRKNGIFKITKLKEYDGNKNEEKMFLEELFKDAIKNGEKTVVTSDRLVNKFYLTIKNIVTNINRNLGDLEENAILKGKICQIILVILGLISLFTALALPMIEYGYQGVALKLGEIILIGLIVTFFLKSKLKNFAIIIAVFISLEYIAFIMIFNLDFLEILKDNNQYIFSLLFSIVCMLIIILLSNRVEYQRSSDGNNMLARIRGFKTFLETVEKEKLENLVNENPTYFYDILPFAYVLGVSDKWIKKFETLALQSPNWYSSNNFNIHDFGTDFNNTMTSSMHYMAYPVRISSNSSSGSDSSSSSSSSSGGGSGGGGGGSW